MLDFNYFIGVDTVARPDYDQYVSAPEAPANYKSFEAIRDYKARKLAEIRQQAGNRPVTGSLREVVLRDSQGRIVFRYAGQAPGEASAALFRFMTDTGFDSWPDRVGATFTPARTVWGDDPEVIFRIAGLDLIRAGHRVPCRFWYHNSALRDPLSILLGACNRELTFVGLIKFLQVQEVPTDWPKADRDSELVRRICVAAQLV